MIELVWSVGGMVLTVYNRITWGKKSAPVPICPPQMPNILG